ncbi:TPA: hypothetical protein QDA71_005513 [Burkholderia vietnamiensis]|uniref:plasmid replication initiator TrfA n=1 Tax=Burkholderia vietnamiensis TaxID=60552 RepID=UPI00158E06C6|nr:plasmid replication initiator TrfA [Burkholderia vietnamiensis]HDR8948447.1 hypothetical protein [Burkholderia vietnamiensis]HDR9210690.1 hypothetical protein [Burkholderia vietnamiensis]
MVKTLIEKTAEIAKRATGKNPLELQQPAEADAARGGQLPLFPEEDTSALPNYLARTPLFAPIQPGRRKMHDQALLASPEGVEVRFTGKQLDMADQDVFMLALKWAQGVDLNEPVRCDRAEFLKALGWKPSGKSGSFGKSAYDWLDQSFQRLTSGTLSIKTKRYKAHLSLVSDWTQDSETGAWDFTVGGKIRALFQNKEYAFIDLAKRQQIAHRVDLAKWLQSYAASHEPGLHRIGVAKLKEWCGYASPTRKFIEALGEALDELERLQIVTHWSFYRDNEMVKWVRL